MSPARRRAITNSLEPNQLPAAGPGISACTSTPAGVSAAARSVLRDYRNLAVAFDDGKFDLGYSLYTLAVASRLKYVVFCQPRFAHAVMKKASLFDHQRSVPV